MKQANLFFVLVAVATISLFSSCTDSTGGYQKPDLSIIASGLHNAGTDTIIVLGLCNIDYVPVVGTNCSGKTVVRKKPVISQGGVAMSIRKEGSSLTSDDLTRRIESVGYRIVPDRRNGYSEVIKNPLKPENSFFENLWSIFKWIFCALLFLTLLVILLLAFWELLKLILSFFRALGYGLGTSPPRPIAQTPVVTTPVVNNWQSESIQVFANDLQNIIKDAVSKGNGVKLSANSSATNTIVDLYITRKEATPVVKQEEEKKKDDLESEKKE